MKSFSSTYQRSFRAGTFLLISALLIPLGLNAKSFAEFCSTEMAMHHNAAHAHNEQSSCHDSMDSPISSAHESHDKCHSVSLCTCDSALNTADIDEWVIPTISAKAVIQSQKIELKPETDSVAIPLVLTFSTSRHAPPLWLLYDTFLT
jgi:hypothetical protein